MKMLSSKQTFVLAGLIGVCLFIAFVLPAGRKLNPGIDEADEVTSSTSEVDLAAELKEELEAAKIIPDILGSFSVDQLVDVVIRYGDLDVINGMEMKPQRASQAPTVTVSSAGLWTLVMVDPDPPSPDNPKFREWLHWIVVNIHSNDGSTGDTIVEYNPPTPPQGKHRYVFLLFRQPGDVAIKPPRVSERGGFKVQEWAKGYKLEGPFAVKYFLAEKQTES